MRLFIELTDLSDGEVAHFRNIEELSKYVERKQNERLKHERETFLEKNPSFLTRVAEWLEKPKPQTSHKKNAEQESVKITANADLGFRDAEQEWGKKWEDTPLLSKIAEINKILNLHDKAEDMKLQLEAALKKAVESKDAREIVSAMQINNDEQKRLFGRVVQYAHSLENEPGHSEMDTIADKVIRRAPFDVRADDYQDYVMQQADGNLVWHEQLINAVWGLGEAGEVMNVLKKFYFHPSRAELFHNYPELKKRVMSELGDLFFYVAWIAYLFDTTPGEIMQYNVRKLNERHKETGGFPKPSEQEGFTGSVFDVDYTE